MTTTTRRFADLARLPERLASVPTEHALWWILRVAAAACFVGHGMFGLLTKAEWVPFFGLVGIPPAAAYALMPLVGIVDIALGMAVLFRPRPILFLYMAAWALWTAALRPLTGDSPYELLERAGNYGVPIALLLFLGPMRTWRDWAAVPSVPRLTPERAALVCRALAWTTALLLFGHGALGAIEGKEPLGEHLLAIGLPAASAAPVGWMEMAFAVVVLLRPRPALLLGVVFWKLGTEMLYPIAGAPIWEFIERGGSYGAPLALAVLLTQHPARAVAPRRPGAASYVAGVLLAALLATPMPAQETTSDASLVAALRHGGYVLAFRHTATDHDARDRGRDRASQRNLTEDGVLQARAIGAAIRELRIPIGEVRANPMYRNRETGEHAFGRATVDSTLAGSGSVSALRTMLAAPVPRGTNRVIVTRIGILNGAFEEHGVRGIDEGDSIIVKPLEDGTFRVVAHLKPGDWVRLRR